jgi:hypothetical protein
MVSGSTSHNSLVMPLWWRDVRLERLRAPGFAVVAAGWASVCVALAVFAQGPELPAWAAVRNAALLFLAPAFLVVAQDPADWHGPGGTARTARWSVVVVLATGAVWGAAVAGSPFDVMFCSGLVVVLAGIELSDRARGRLAAALDAVVARRLLSDRTALLHHITARTRRDRVIGAVAISMVIFLSWAVRLGFDPYGLMTRPVAVQVIIAAGVGIRIGDMVAWGTLGRSMEETKTPLGIAPGHPDGAAGLAPLGDFYLYQAWVATLPAGYLAGWLVLIPLWGSAYAGWRGPYAGLLAVAITVEVLVFVLPMRVVHRVMAARKATILDRFDREHTLTMRSLQDGLAEEDSKAREDHKQRLADLRELYGVYTAIPTWPVSASIRRRFGLANLALALPIAGDLIAGSSVWVHVSDLLRGLSGA